MSTTSRYAIAPLVKAETAWVSPWLVSTLTQHGRHHYEQSQPSGDWHCVGHTLGCLWMIAADGISSAPLSHVGSRIACETANAYLGNALLKGTAPSRKLLRDAMASAHAALSTRAIADRNPLHDYATTFAAALLSGTSLYSASLGDSAVLAGFTHQDYNGTLQSKLAPITSSYNHPKSVSSLHEHQWQSFTAFSESENTDLSLVIVATDGMTDFPVKRLGIRDRFNTDWPAFMQDRLAQLTPRLYINAFLAYLETKDQENDDRTLIFAYRPPGSLAPSFTQP